MRWQRGTGRRVVNFQEDEGERIAPRAKASNVTRVKYPRSTSFQAFSILLFCLPACLPGGVKGDKKHGKHLSPARGHDEWAAMCVRSARELILIRPLESRQRERNRTR